MRAGPTYCLYLLPYTTIPTPTAIEFLLASPHALAVGHTLVSQALSSPILSSHSLGERFVSPQMHCPLSHYILELFFISLASFFWLTFCLAPVFMPLFRLLQFRPRFFCRSSISYSLVPFFWRNIYLTPVFSFLLSLTVSSIFF